LIEKTPDLYVGKTITTPYDNLVKADLSPKAVQYLKVALLPVGAVYLLGWAFVWVRRGFIKPLG
jgi:hypothetical protein